MSSTCPISSALSAPAKARVPLLAAKLHIHFLVVDDVVAMQATLGGLQIRRAIHMRDTKILEINGHSGGVIECEVQV